MVASIRWLASDSNHAMIHFYALISKGRWCQGPLALIGSWLARFDQGVSGETGQEQLASGKVVPYQWSRALIGTLLPHFGDSLLFGKYLKVYERRTGREAPELYKLGIDELTGGLSTCACKLLTRLLTARPLGEELSHRIPSWKGNVRLGVIGS